MPLAARKVKIPLSSLASEKCSRSFDCGTARFPRHGVLLGGGVEMRGFARHSYFDILSTGELPLERGPIAAIVPANLSRSHMDFHHYFSSLQALDQAAPGLSTAAGTRDMATMVARRHF